jgi:TolA-binding protein
MTSKREEELEQKISQLRIDMGYEISKVRESAMGSVRTSTEDVSRKAQDARTEIDDLRRQLALTQGALDELQTKFTRFASAGRGRSQGTDDSAIRFSEVEYAIDRLERRLERLQEKEDSSASKAKLDPKVASVEKLEKALSTAYQQKDYKKVQSVSSGVLAAKAHQSLLEVALRYRGEARFASQDYAGSASDFSEFVDKFSRSEKYPRALLLAGDSYVYLRKFRLAKSFYSECSRMAPEKEECKVSKERLAKLPAE